MPQALIVTILALGICPPAAAQASSVRLGTVPLPPSLTVALPKAHLVQAAPTAFAEENGGRGLRYGLLGMGIGVVAGLGTGYLLNEVRPPASTERYVGLPFLLGLWGFLAGYGVGR